MRMPDFLIIGAMKCGTSTLHEQLARQPGIFMSNPKEIYFFSDDEVYANGIEWYASHFSEATPGCLCGESSTHYTKLPTYPETISRMKAHVPGVRCIYVMRHPIDRLVSQYIHEWTQCVVHDGINESLDTNPELIDYSRYAYQIQPFLEAFGPERVLPMFFEGMLARPEEELKRVCRFIGYTGPEPVWHGDAAQENRSSDRIRRSPIRDAIAYAPVISTIRKRLVPRKARDWVKDLWKLKERPELTPENTARLQRIFDDDLETLGGWLGMRLDCANFKEVARTTTPAWSAHVPL